MSDIAKPATTDIWDLVLRTVAPGLTREEAELFAAIARRTGLDPLTRQIYAIPRGQGRDRRLSIIVGIDGLRALADRTGTYAPGRPTEYLLDDRGQLVAATVWVRKRTADGQWHEYGETAYLNEFRGQSPLWRAMPRVMLAKCAEARALRRGWPGESAGLSVAEALDGDDASPAPARPVLAAAAAEDATTEDKDSGRQDPRDPREVLRALVAARPVLAPKICRHYDVAGLEDLTDAQVLEALERIRTRREGGQQDDPPS